MAKQENKMLNKELIELKIGDLYLYDANEGIELMTATLSSAELSSSVDKTDVRGGTANSVIYTIPGEREMTFTVTDVVNKVDIKSLKEGNLIREVDTQELYNYHIPKFYNVVIQTTQATLTLDQEPSDTTETIMIYKEDGSLIESTNITITGKDVEIDNSSLGLKAGDKVRVMGYKYKVSADALFYTLSAEGATQKLVAVYRKPVLDRKTMKAVYYKTTYYPCVIMDSNYTESDQTSPEAIEEQHTFTITKDDTEDVLGYVYYEKIN
jgi:lipopolysaccharide export system protein LptA